MLVELHVMRTGVTVSELAAHDCLSLAANVGWRLLEAVVLRERRLHLVHVE